MTSTNHNKSIICLKISSLFFIGLILFSCYHWGKGYGFNSFPTPYILLTAGILSSSLTGLVFGLLGSVEEDQRKEQLFVRLAHFIIVFVLGASIFMTYILVNAFRT